MANPLAQLLLPKKPTPEEAAATLAGDNPLAQLFQRGTVRGLNGEVSSDYTPSAYNQERDATLAQDTDEKQKIANAKAETIGAATTAQTDPMVKAEADQKLQDELQLHRVDHPVTDAGNLAVENAKAAEALALDEQQRKGNVDALLQLMHPTGSDTTTSAPRFKLNVNSHLEPSLSEIPDKPLGALEQRSITSFKEAQPILDDLERTLHPDQNQLLSLLKNSGAGVAYKSGLSIDPAMQSKTQLAGLLQVLGSSPYVVGSRSYQMIKLAMQHLTNPNQSDKFMQQQINEIRSLWPRMQDEILAAHDTPGSPLNQGAPNDPYANPDYQPR